MAWSRPPDLRTVATESFPPIEEWSPARLDAHLGQVAGGIVMVIVTLNPKADLLDHFSSAAQ
jgi:hypothetical protein